MVGRHASAGCSWGHRRSKFSREKPSQNATAAAQTRKPIGDEIGYDTNDEHDRPNVMGSSCLLRCSHRGSDPPMPPYPLDLRSSTAHSYALISLLGCNPERQLLIQAAGTRGADESPFVVMLLPSFQARRGIKIFSCCYTAARCDFAHIYPGQLVSHAVQTVSHSFSVTATRGRSEKLASEEAGPTPMFHSVFIEVAACMRQRQYFVTCVIPQLRPILAAAS